MLLPRRLLFPQVLKDEDLDPVLADVARSRPGQLVNKAFEVAVRHWSQYRVFVDTLLKLQLLDDNSSTELRVVLYCLFLYRHGDSQPVMFLYRTEPLPAHRCCDRPCADVSGGTFTIRPCSCMQFHCDANFVPGQRPNIIISVLCAQVT